MVASSGIVMPSLLLIELLMVGVIMAGWWAGAALGKWFRRDRRANDADHAEAVDDERSTDRITDSLAFVGGAYGILLGLLLVFAVGHFVDTRQAAREEAISAVALFNSVEPYPAEQRDRVRHDLICLMRSSATDDWAASTASDFTGSENTNAYAVAVQRQLEALPQESAVEASNHYFVTDSNLALAKARQLRLLYAAPEIPPAVWVVIYVSAFVFVGLMAFHLGERRRLARVALPATGLVLVAIVGSLAVLDTPFSGAGVALRPLALEAALTRLQDAYPEPASMWSGCDRLAAEQAE
ncbi:MAG: DUF4239 domain-containing protein [Actinobacteria bacterium]|nr:MAG: DUF4239 domain-containing protein [Actinomycetota bacterium]